jgi:hypothetical protein
MKAQFENIGRGDPSGSADIEVRFYLSRGLKEDRHSEWRRVGTDIIKPSNLRSGQTHTETEGLEVANVISKPGMYNIVACVDRIRDEDNGVGAYQEEHESNNCSTEAVFEVKAEAFVNVAQHDFIVSAIQLANTPQPVPAGGQMGAHMQIRNIGNAKPGTGSRSAYEVCGPLPDTTCRMIADDGSDADELAPGRDQGEEIKSLVAAPTRAGTYQLCGVANYQRTVAETDYSNNRTCITFEVRGAAPDFVVTAIGLAVGKTSAKKGDKLNPAMVIANVGNGDAPRGIRSAYYYSGPETGGAWRYIADDGSDAGDLRAGRSIREEIKDGLKIKTAGTYYFRGCADYQLAVAESNEDNNCAVSGPVSIR